MEMGFTIGRGDNFSDVAQARTDVKHGRTDSHYVVDFTGMHQPYEGVAHHHHMQVRRRQRAGKLIQRLVGKTEDVA